MGTKPKAKQPVRRKVVNKGGRPSGYRPEFVEQARKLAHLGATDWDISQFFSVSIMTIHRWRISFPEFCDALKAGKEALDNRIETSLYHRAIGYSFESEKIFNDKGEIIRAKTIEHVPPDTTAMIFWLKNRRPAEWRDRREEVRMDIQMSLAELVNLSYGQNLPRLPETKIIDGETEKS